MITSPIITRQMRHAITISASELVGLINSSRVQLFEEASGENTISCEFGMIGVHTRIERVPPTEKAAVKLST